MINFYYQENPGIEDFSDNWHCKNMPIEINVLELIPCYNVQ